MITDPQNLIAFAMPFLIDLVNRKVEDARVRFLVAWGACIIAGVVLHLDLVLAKDWDNLGANIVTIVLAAQATYHLYWEKSKARETTLKALDAGYEDGKK